MTANQVSQNAYERIRAMTLGGNKRLPNYLNEVTFDDQSDDRMLKLLQSKQLNQQAEGPSAMVSEHDFRREDDDKDFFSLPKAKKLREELVEKNRIIAELTVKLES